jgi:DinB superfamily
MSSVTHDPATEAWRRSIGARVAVMNGMLDAAVADMTLAQVNHRERSGVLSIAFSLAHVVGGQDRSVAQLLDRGPSLWESGGWAKRVGLAGDLPKRGTPMADAEKVQFGDLDAWRAYQSAVFARTGSSLANAPLARFDEDAFDGTRPPTARGSFLFMLVPSGPIRVMDCCEAYLFQHAARHLGEIEHARALVGLGGLS